MKEGSRLPVTCRPARESDTADVLELTRTIWDGEDYVPSAWPDWLADPEGLLSVAEYEGRVIGLGKLTRQGLDDWWLEGLRTHPDFEGRGVASQLHEYQVAYWLQNGRGMLRLATASFRHAVHRLCEHTGFRKIAEFIPYSATPLAGPHGFRRLEAREAAEALPFFLSSPTVIMAAGLMNLDWVWTPISADRLAETGSRAGVWEWGRAGVGSPFRQAMLMFSDLQEKPDDPAVPFIQALACPQEVLVACLVDYRRLVGSLGYQKAAWTAPGDPVLLPALQEAGYSRDWDASIYIFEKPWNPASSGAR